MQTNFSPEALLDPATKSSESVIRKCVHCGFCTATCPTYVLLGDELDSPRGRIYLMKDMLENERQPEAAVVKHIDRCLSCLSCMSTCPSGVNYMHLIDHARSYIHENYKRPLFERIVRGTLAWVLPHRRRFKLALRLARIVKPFTGLLQGVSAFQPLVAMLELAPDHLAKDMGVVSQSIAAKRGRVVLLQGCAEPVLRPEIRAATVRVLNRAGYEVAFANDEGCCGALVHHMGREEAGLQAARKNVDAWWAEKDVEGVDAIIITTSGCGTTIKDYGFMLRNDPNYAERAAQISALAKDISEFLENTGLVASTAVDMIVAYHPACSLQHGQKIVDAPKKLLKMLGYTVKTPSEAHLCCGSAGTYNILQPEIAGQLGVRKAGNLDALGADVIATGNIGCGIQIGKYSNVPIAHTIELVDWATGGPRPNAMHNDRKK